MSSTKDVKESTVDRRTKEFVDASKGKMTVREAREIAISSAERVNRNRKEK
jgi:hypothetical protein